MIEVNFVQCTVEKVPMRDMRDVFYSTQMQDHTRVDQSYNVVPNMFVRNSAIPIKKWRENCRGTETETLIAIHPSVHDAIMQMRVPELHRIMKQEHAAELSLVESNAQEQIKVANQKVSMVIGLADNLTKASLWTRMVWLFTGVPKIKVIQ